jgi:hypothetical protein
LRWASVPVVAQQAAALLLAGEALEGQLALAVAHRVDHRLERLGDVVLRGGEGEGGDEGDQRGERATEHGAFLQQRCFSRKVSGAFLAQLADACKGSRIQRPPAKVG